MGPFTDLDQLKVEKQRLRRLNAQHAMRLKELGGELTQPKALGALLKNSIFGSNGASTGNSAFSNAAQFAGPFAKAAGLILGSRFLAGRGRLIQLAGVVLPMFFKNNMPSMEKVGEELSVSFEHLKQFWERKHSSAEAEDVDHQ